MDPVIDAQLREAVKALRDARPHDAIAVLDPLTATVVGDIGAELVVRQLLATAQVGAGDLDEARRHGERALDLARLTGDDEAIAHAHAFLRQLSPDGSLFAGTEHEGDAVDRAFDDAAHALTRGDGLGAARALEPVLIGAAAAGDVAIEASASGMMAQAMMMIGHLAEARRQAHRALELAEHSGDDRAQAHFAELLTHLATQETADEAMAAARVAARTRAALGIAGQAMEQGDPGAALQVLWPVLHDACHTSATGAEASLRALIAQALLAEDKRTEAVDQANKAAALADSLGDAEAASAFRQIAELALGFLPPTGEA